MIKIATSSWSADVEALTEVYNIIIMNKITTSSSAAIVGVGSSTTSIEPILHGASTRTTIPVSSTTIPATSTSKSTTTAPLIGSTSEPIVCWKTYN